MKKIKGIFKGHHHSKDSKEKKPVNENQELWDKFEISLNENSKKYSKHYI